MMHPKEWLNYEDLVRPVFNSGTQSFLNDTAPVSRDPGEKRLVKHSN